MSTSTTILWVALGGGAGAALRFYVGRLLDGSFHVGTLVANTVASLLLGLFVGWSADGATWALVATGFCGGLSTYSSFAVQARDLGAGRGAPYAALTIGLGLAACGLGFAVAAG